MLPARPPSSRISACSSVSAERLRATSSRPDVSRSSRWTSSSDSRRAQCAQGFDRTEGDAAAAMAGHARRFVDRQQARVLEHDARFDRVQQALRRRAPVGGFLDADRRYPDLVAGFELPLGLHPPAVDPDLPGAQQLVDEAAGRALEVAEQEVVDPLPVAIFGDPHGLRCDPGGYRRRGVGRRGGASEWVIRGLICYTRRAR